MKSSPIYIKLQHYLIDHACIWIFLTLMCVNWTIKDHKREGRKERESGVVGDGVCGCSFYELLDKNKPFRPLYSNTYLKIISSCSFESVGLPLVKSLMSKTQSLSSQLRLWNNVCLIFVY